MPFTLHAHTFGQNLDPSADKDTAMHPAVCRNVSSRAWWHAALVYRNATPHAGCMLLYSVKEQI
jgi:hypothetical protein